MSATNADRSLVVDLYGDHCPVQAEGTVDGTPFYFRSRGQRWSLEIGERVFARPEWRYAEPYGDVPFAAGWISAEEAIAFIGKAADLYRTRTPSPKGSYTTTSYRSGPGGAGIPAAREDAPAREDARGV